MKAVGYKDCKFKRKFVSKVRTVCCLKTKTTILEMTVLCVQYHDMANSRRREENQREEDKLYNEPNY